MEKKVYTIEKFIELITAPIEKVQLSLLILAGHNKMELNGKSEQELRQMVLDYVTVNEDELFDALSYGNLKTVVGLQKAVQLLGLPIEELDKRLGFNVQSVKEESSEKAEKDSLPKKEDYLFHTEELYEKIVSEFLNSKLSNQERAVFYIEKVKELRKLYTDYAAQTPGFIGNSRYKEVYEFFQTIPKVELYKFDDKVGDYINMARAKAHYDDMAKKIESGWGIGGNGNAPKSL